MMRKLNSWKAIVGVSTLLMGLGLVTSPGQVVRAVTAISQIGADIDGAAAGDESGFSVAMSADGTRVAIGAWQPSSGNAGYVRIYTLTNGAWTQTGSDINGTAAGDQLGYSVAMSADGNRVAIGATQANRGYVRIFTLNGTAWTQTGGDIIGEGSADESGNSVAMSADGTRVAIGASWNAGGRGHVRVYTLIGNTWTQTGLDIDGEAAGDRSGYSVAMSADGNRVAIGALENDDTDPEAGHVRIYSWNGTAWTQTGTDIDGEAEEDYSGYSVAMSDDGTRVAIGATGNDNSRGHVRIYSWSGTAWTQTGTDINGEAASDWSGYSVAMSSDGNRVAIGADSNDGTGNGAGHARVYTLIGNTWTQTGTDIDGEAASDRSGYSVAMSSDGNRVAIGAVNNDNGNGSNAGHVRVYAVQNSPSAPTISSITAADSSLAVAFTTGTDGGSPITNYKYSVNGTDYIARNPAATTSPFTISGLTNGTTYSVTIKAVNAIGDSVASNAVSGTPTETTSSLTVTQPSATIVRSLSIKEIVASKKVAPGSSIKIEAEGFTPSESVLVGILGSTNTPSQVSADSRGAIATNVSIPADAAGKVTVYAYGQTSKRGYRQVVNVNAAEELPATGSDSSILTLFGVSLLATGLLFTARRRLTR